MVSSWKLYGELLYRHYLRCLGLVSDFLFPLFSIREHRVLSNSDYISLMLSLLDHTLSHIHCELVSHDCCRLGWQDFWWLRVDAQFLLVDTLWLGDLGMLDGVTVWIVVFKINQLLIFVGTVDLVYHSHAYCKGHGGLFYQGHNYRSWCLRLESSWAILEAIGRL